MKIALPVWQGRISPVFDTAGLLRIVEFRNREEVKRWETPIGEDSFAGRVDLMRRLGVEVLLCGALSRPLAGLIVSQGITLVPWLAGDADQIVRSYLQKGEPDLRYIMPGCMPGHGRGGGRRRRRRGRSF